jgi:FKBP-type peptidyl-prolyl cis-trans isomerase SlpA
MTKVKDGSTVKVHYTGKLTDGTIFDSSEGREPLAFTIGAGMMIAGFEKGVLDMELNEEKTISIQPEDGYGLVRDDMIAEVPKAQLPPDMEVEAGMELMSQTPDGQQMVVKVVDVKAESIVVDANHPLAGKDLVFEVKVVEVT